MKNIKKKNCCEKDKQSVELKKIQKFKDKEILLIIAQFATVAVILMQCYVGDKMNQISRDMSKISEKTYKSEIHTVVNEFLSEEMWRVRAKCILLREEYYNDTINYREKLKIIIEKEIMDYRFDKTKWEKFLEKDSVLFEKYRYLIRFLRYFEALSFLDLSEENTKTIHYYYIWWRGFIIDIVKIYNEVWSSSDSRSIRPPWTYQMINNLDSKIKEYNLPLEVN